MRAVTGLIARFTADRCWMAMKRSRSIRFLKGAVTDEVIGSSSS